VIVFLFSKEPIMKTRTQEDFMLILTQKTALAIDISNFVHANTFGSIISYRAPT